MRVVFATCSAVPNGWPDDHPAAELLQADRRPWDDANVDWSSYDRVVVRSASAARDTGRFSPKTHTLAAELISRIQASGRVALVQQYLPSVDERGERSFVFFGGQLSHVLHKAPVLRLDEVAPIAEEGLGRELGVAQAMLDPGLVVPGEADPDEHALAHEVHTEISNRFGTPLLLRVDLVRDLIGAPLVMEIEAIEPLLYLLTNPGATEAFAAAVRAS